MYARTGDLCQLFALAVKPIWVCGRASLIDPERCVSRGIQSIPVLAGHCWYHMNIRNIWGKWNGKPTRTSGATWFCAPQGYRDAGHWLSRWCHNILSSYQGLRPAYPQSNIERTENIGFNNLFQVVRLTVTQTYIYLFNCNWAFARWQCLQKNIHSTREQHIHLTKSHSTAQIQWHK
jgi:hypothetical protein